MTTNTEKKFQLLDLKEVSEEGVFEGYASKFGDRDQGGDTVMKGAFKNSLSQRKAKGVKMLWQHDPSHPIGVWDEIKEDATGLFVRGRLLTTVQKAKETYELMKAGVIDGLSIGYRTIKSLRDDATGFRQLKEVDLWEISLVTFPMLTSATVTSVKGDWTKREVERVLRDAGMPNAMAVKLIAGGYDAANSGGQRDADDGLNGLAETIRQMNDNLQRRL
ncbi:phage prohead protease [Caudoviricetes sp.]|nr:phage prohead protease [Caudoviricetes sp.]